MAEVAERTVADEQTRILRVIDMVAGETSMNTLTGFKGVSYGEDPERPVSDLSRERLEKYYLELSKAMVAIYQYAHLGVFHCGNPHEDWAQDFVEGELKMAWANVIPPPDEPFERDRKPSLPEVDIPAFCEKLLAEEIQRSAEQGHDKKQVLEWVATKKHEKMLGRKITMDDIEKHWTK